MAAMSDDSYRAEGATTAAAAADPQMVTESKGLYFAIRELHSYSKRRGMLELRLRVLSFITDYLNQVNTQAMLVAGCAMSLLISSELTEVEQNERGSLLADYMYVTFACGCLASSLWVIYTSMNLVNLSTAALLQSTKEVGIVESESLLLARMGDVRLIFMVSLVRSHSMTRPRGHATRPCHGRAA